MSDIATDLVRNREEALRILQKRRALAVKAGDGRKALLLELTISLLEDPVGSPRPPRDTPH